MHRVKLPGSFEGITIEKLFDLIDDFVHQNQRYIPSQQLRNWREGDHKCRFRVPTMFMTLLKENDFIFPKDSIVTKLGIKNPDVSHLCYIYKKGTTDPRKVKGSSNEVRHPSREYNRIVRVNPNGKTTVSLCTKEDCFNINSGKCSTHPLSPTKEGSIVTDCLRYTPKEFKFKTFGDALVANSDPND
jgi:hypothetical protein